MFRASPIYQAAIRWITPLGNLNPPEHTRPSDHIYFYFAAPDAGEQPAARLAGNWFAENGNAPLTFAYDTYDPSQVRIAFANVFVTGGVFGIAATDPAPRDVSAASGPILYTLTRGITGPPVSGTSSAARLVQMLTAARIQVEYVQPVANAAAFTAASRFAVR